MVNSALWQVLQGRRVQSDCHKPASKGLALPIDAQLRGSLQGILFNKGDSLYRADFIFVLVLGFFFSPLYK